MKPQQIKDIDLNTLKPDQKVWVEFTVSKIDEGNPEQPLRIVDPWDGEGHWATANTHILTESQVQPLPDLEGLEWVHYKDRKPTEEDEYTQHGTSYILCKSESGLLWKSHEPNSYRAYYLRNGKRLYDYLRSLPIAEKPDPIAKGHNPDRLTESQVGVADGWRLLEREEVVPERTLKHLDYMAIECWVSGYWDDTGWAGNSKAYTYRTRKPAGCFLPSKPRILVDPDTGERFEVVDGKVLEEVDNG